MILLVNTRRGSMKRFILIIIVIDIMMNRVIDVGMLYGKI